MNDNGQKLNGMTMQVVEVDGKGVLPQPSPNTADVVSGCIPPTTVKVLSAKDQIIQLIQSSGAQLLAVQKLASAQNAMAMDLPVFKEMTVISKRLNEMMLEVSRLRGL